jgi:hypothetical protein
VGNAIYTHLVCEHGVPSCVQSDRGAELISAALQSLCQRWGIERIATSGLQPQAMGHIERTHRYLNAALTILYNKHRNDWDFYIPAVLFAHRISPSTATGYSPFKLVYGRDPVAPAERLYDLDDKREMFATEAEWVNRLSATMLEAYEAARAFQSKEDTKSVARRRADQHKSGVHYEPGDLVYLWEDKSELMPRADRSHMVRVPHKLRYRWTGPHKIVSKGSHNSVAIDHATKGRRNANVNRLHLCRRWNDDHVDTHDAQAVRPSGPDDPADDPEAVRQEFRTEGEPLPGELLVFALEDEDSPFSVGSFTHKATGCNCSSETACKKRKCPVYYYFEWMGNFHERLDGVYRKAWLDGKNGFYYRDRRSHQTHRRATNEDGGQGTWIQREQVLAFGFSLTPAAKLPASVYRLLSDNALVQWTHPDHL